MGRKNKMTAQEIYRRIYNRHINKGEWCFSEVPINGTGSQRMDAWVIKPGYPEHTTGYEIKVSRSDFLQDKKWQNYLPFCDAFFFICPPGLIQEAELPKEAGLIYVMPKILKTIKYSDKGQAIANATFLLGLIINRLNPHIFKDREERIQLFKAWRERDQEAKLMGRYCSKKVREQEMALEKTISDMSWKIRTLEDELLLCQDSNEMAKEIKRLKANIEQRCQWYEELAQENVKLRKEARKHEESKESLR
jgi:hypothetical protein